MKTDISKTSVPHISTDENPRIKQESAQNAKQSNSSIRSKDSLKSTEKTRMVKLSISMPQETVEQIKQERMKLIIKFPEKKVTVSSVINAHLKRSLKIPAEVKL